MTSGGPAIFGELVHQADFRINDFGTIRPLQGSQMTPPSRKISPDLQESRRKIRMKMKYHDDSKPLVETAV
jgi:hypothetical protein